MQASSNFAFFIATAVFLIPAFGQEWTYQSYVDGKPGYSGSLQLRETEPGKHRARLMFPRPDRCFQAEVPATVSVEQDVQIVTMEPLMQGCPKIRFLLKLDGSGGKRETHQADGSWRGEIVERGLKKK